MKMKQTKQLPIKTTIRAGINLDELQGDLQRIVVKAAEAGQDKLGQLQMSLEQNM